MREKILTIIGISCVLSFLGYVIYLSSKNQCNITEQEFEQAIRQAVQKGDQKEYNNILLKYGHCFTGK